MENREHKIGKMIVGYEPFRGGWKMYVARNDERMAIDVGAGSEDVVWGRMKLLAKMIEDQIGEDCREVQSQAFQAGIESCR